MNKWSDQKNSWWKESIDYSETDYGEYQSYLDQNQGQDLIGLPGEVNVPNQGRLQFHSNQSLQDLANNYTNSREYGGNFPQEYVKVNPEQASQVAQEYDSLEHSPNDPQVQESYQSFAQETLEQYQELVEAGYTFEFYPEDGTDPYPNSPREAIMDLYQNKHMYVYPTESGFGSDDDPYSDHPLLEDSGIKWGGKPVTYNDLFRAVHDVYGHGKEGLGFRADGEDNAYRSHSQMYSDVARGAMAAETRMQNSWVNYHPEYGEQNRNANTQDTVFAPQKAVVAPQWIQNPDLHWKTSIRSDWWNT
jgi:hypothetical protein